MTGFLVGIYPVEEVFVIKFHCASDVLNATSFYFKVAKNAPSFKILSNYVHKMLL